MHDPITLNRQGYDIGDEYRSITLCHDDTQKQIAEDMAANFAPTLYKDPIVTQILPFEAFWKMDEDMQDFYNCNPNAGYCMVIIDPKNQKLRQKFATRIKKTQALHLGLFN